MKNNFKKFLLLTVPTLILSAIFALSVSAYTTDLMPEGAANTDPDFIPSGYSDIDENDGWLNKYGFSYSCSRSSGFSI